MNGKVSLIAAVGAAAALTGCCRCGGISGRDFGTTKYGEKAHVAEMRGQARALEVWTDQTGLQFYAGNFIQDGWTMKDGRPMKRRSYLALETQHFPNSPNRPDFPTTNLRPGEVYRTVTEYRFKVL